MEHLHHQSWLMIANGDGMPTSRLRQWDKHLIWAIDGGANWCYDHEIVPTVISGDFDSIRHPHHWGIQAKHPSNDSLIPYPGAHGTTIIFTGDQNHTDTHKALTLACQLHATSLVLAHAVGHRMDHTLHHLELMRAFYHPHRPLVTLSRDFDMRMVKQQRVRITNQQGAQFACFGAPKATITSSGLAYDMHHYTVEWGQSSSVSNRVASCETEVAINGSALILLSPHDQQDSDVSVENF